MGYEYGDAQNIAVRCFLNQFSKQFKYFDNFYRQKTLEYFDNRCPYTGIKLTYNNSERDHIIPFNKDFCGLHVYGNILIVSKEANSQKGSKTIEEYLQNDPIKLQKIKKFIEETGYNEIHNKYNYELTITSRILYEKVGKVIKETYQNFQSNNLSSNTDLHSFKTKEYYLKNKIYSPSIENKSMSLKQPTLSKQDIKTLCQKNGFIIQGDFTKAGKNKTQNNYWANPSMSRLSKDWILVLDDYVNNIIYCFKVPANSLNLNQVKTRNDQPNKIDLQIQYNDPFFTDTRSKILFNKWMIKKINY